MLAAQLARFGEPVQLELNDVPSPARGPGELLIDVDAAGVNYHDINVAINLFGADVTLPHVLGSEVVGHLSDGRRVAALCEHGGGFAEQVSVREDRIFPVPEGVSDLQALAMVIQGNTAWHLLHSVARVRAGEAVLVHAAAGGVGSLLVQLARAAGVGQIIATASSESKRRLVRELGADLVLDSRADDLADRIWTATGERGVDIVLDSVGGAVFDSSLTLLAPFGRAVNFGLAGRLAPQPLNVRDLVPGIRSVAGFYLGSCPVAELRGSTAAVMTACARGELRVIDGGSYPLRRAAHALRDLASRRTTGKLVVRMTDDPAGPASPSGAGSG